MDRKPFAVYDVAEGAGVHQNTSKLTGAQGRDLAFAGFWGFVYFRPAFGLGLWVFLVDFDHSFLIYFFAIWIIFYSFRTISDVWNSILDCAKSSLWSS